MVFWAYKIYRFSSLFLRFSMIFVFVLSVHRQIWSCIFVSLQLIMVNVRLNKSNTWIWDSFSSVFPYFCCFCIVFVFMFDGIDLKSSVFSLFLSTVLFLQGLFYNVLHPFFRCYCACNNLPTVNEVPILSFPTHVRASGNKRQKKIIEDLPF